MRFVPLAPELAGILRRWLLANPGELVVMVPEEGGRRPIADADALDVRSRRASRRAAIAEVTFHQLRHTAASHLAQRVPLPMVGAVLGHADVKTTARYAHLDTEGLARDPRLHLTYAAPSGTVLPFASGPPVDRKEARRRSKR